MRIPWLRATPAGAEPYAVLIMSVASVFSIGVGIVGAAVEFLRQSFLAASVDAFLAAATSGVLLWGLHQAHQQQLWLRRIGHDIDAAAHRAAMARLQREQLTRDMARYQTATSERRH